MSSCEDQPSRIDLYLDGELRDEELEAFNNHIKECSSCRRELKERRRFLEQLRAAGPLYTPSTEFRAEMSALLAAPVNSTTGTPQYRPAVSVAKHRAPFWLLWLFSRPVPALIACVLAVAGIMTLWTFSLTQAHANAFVDAAVEAHRRQMAGVLPLEVRSNSAAQTSAWFATRVPFHFRLPASQETEGQEQKYELTGGRLVDFRGTKAAYVAYHIHAQLISLLVTSNSTSVASGGEKTISRAITFHTHRRGDLQVMTWSVHNLTYALVSGVNLPARQSCGVCHASVKDKELLRDFRSLNSRTQIAAKSVVLSDHDVWHVIAFR